MSIFAVSASISANLTVPPEYKIQFELAKKFLPLNKTKDNLEDEEITQIISVLTKEAENFIAVQRVHNGLNNRAN